MSALTQEEGAAKSRPQYHIPKADLVIRHKNECAKSELIIPIQLVCNTPDEILIEQVTENSKRQLPWLGATSPHSHKAILIGGGPSIAETFDQILKLKLANPTSVVFAMNGAAKYLADRGFIADYQVMVDARERTAELVCDNVVKGYIFGSQVHPKTIDTALSLKEDFNEVRLAHINFEPDPDGFSKYLPEDRVSSEEFVLVGSNGSVGNVALTVVYAMGFRDLHVFGYDSSFREDRGHAYSQPMNASEPVAEIEYGGKKYRMTYTMKSQADVFPRLAYELETLGCHFTVYGDGFLPDRWNGERSKPLLIREEQKYAEMWGRSEYKDMIPGIAKVDEAFNLLGMRSNERVIDFGTGTGRAAMAFLEKKMSVIAVDITEAGLEFPALHFVKAPLWDLPLHLKSDWGFCTDVMEHIPTDKVVLALSQIANACRRGAYFLIDSVPDEMGILIGQPLHLTVKPPKWWFEKLKLVFGHVEEYTGGVFVCRHRP